MLDLRETVHPTPTSPWLDPDRYWRDIHAAVRDRPAPAAVVSVPALRHNALDLMVRAAGLPIRIATKSVRSREIVDAVLDMPGFRGLLAFTLDEALWLSARHDDIVVGYPTADRAALARLSADEEHARRITVMVDDEDQLDLIDAVCPPHARAPIRVAIEADASWRAPVLGHVGVRRSPVRTPAQARELARRILARSGFELDGLMMYEAQIAGVGDRGSPSVAWMQRRSGAELRERRAALVDAVTAVTPLRFVNGGGTGSLEYTAGDAAVTELTAGSGLLAGHLFDAYSTFSPAPAAAFGLDVVRRPAPGMVTVLGGGWAASGPTGADRAPQAVWPAGLSLLAREGAGEVQTPLQGAAADGLRVGDRVWFRHAKSGELSERVAGFDLVEAGKLVGHVPTYRGEGKAFL